MIGGKHLIRLKGPQEQSDIVLRGTWYCEHSKAFWTQQDKEGTYRGEVVEQGIQRKGYLKSAMNKMDPKYKIYIYGVIYVSAVSLYLKGLRAHTFTHSHE